MRCKRSPPPGPSTSQKFSGFRLCRPRRFSPAPAPAPAPISNVAAYYFAHAAVSAAWQAAGVSSSDGSSLPAADDIIGNEAAPGPGGTLVPTGIYALDKIDLFNILCIPDATRAASGQPSTPDLPDSEINAIYWAAMEYCKRRRAFLIVNSPPNVNDVASAIEWRSNRLRLDMENGAVYFPRVQIADPLNDYNLRAFAPCGTMAGIYANEDANRGVWKAPAGIETRLAGVQKLTYNLSDDEQGVLNPIALNCLRTFPDLRASRLGRAHPALASDQRARNGNTFRSAAPPCSSKKASIAARSGSFSSPTMNRLWAQIRLNVGAFMHDLFRQGAFQGTDAARRLLRQVRSARRPPRTISTWAS